MKLPHYGYCELLKHKKICQVYFSVYKGKDCGNFKVWLELYEILYSYSY